MYGASWYWMLTLLYTRMRALPLGVTAVGDGFSALGMPCITEKLT